MHGLTHIAEAHTNISNILHLNHAVLEQWHVYFCTTDPDHRILLLTLTLIEINIRFTNHRFCILCWWRFLFLEMHNLVRLFSHLSKRRGNIRTQALKCFSTSIVRNGQDETPYSKCYIHGFAFVRCFEMYMSIIFRRCIHHYSSVCLSVNSDYPSHYHRFWYTNVNLYSLENCVMFFENVDFFTCYVGKSAKKGPK